MTDTVELTPDQLRVGLYVHLDLKWFEHPFAFNSFLIRSEEQLRILRSLGLRSLRCDPARSETRPPSPQRHSSPEAEPAAVGTDPGEMDAVLGAKRAMVERVRRYREAAERIAEAFAGMAETFREIEGELSTRPEKCVRQATALVARMAAALRDAPELAIHSMGERAGRDEVHFHPLNVAMLSLIMAREIKLAPEPAGILGLGALFHDIGRREIPSCIFTKMDPLSREERNLYERHCRYGVDIGLGLNLDPGVLDIIREHHEFFDGSGYPARLKGESIGFLSRIVVIANYFDELCNPANVGEALTPHEALSEMFARQRSKFDPRLLQVFIRCLGIYPPGTVVQLSNGLIGRVATVNAAKPLKPMVVVYDATAPKGEAFMVDLAREADVNVAKAIRPGQLPREIYRYLGPRKRVSYYFDAPGPGQEAGVP